MLTAAAERDLGREELVGCASWREVGRQLQGLDHDDGSGERGLGCSRSFTELGPMEKMREMGRRDGGEI